MGAATGSVTVKTAALPSAAEAGATLTALPTPSSFSVRLTEQAPAWVSQVPRPAAPPGSDSSPLAVPSAVVTSKKAPLPELAAGICAVMVLSLVSRSGSPAGVRVISATVAEPPARPAKITAGLAGSVTSSVTPAGVPASFSVNGRGSIAGVNLNGALSLSPATSARPSVRRRVAVAVASPSVREASGAAKVTVVGSSSVTVTVTGAILMPS